MADVGNNCIRRISRSGIVSTYAGSGAPGYLDGSATSSNFDSPSGIACDANNNIYVADELNYRVRKLTPPSTLWSNGATTSSIRVSNSGSYTCRTINGGCTSAMSAPVVVTSVVNNIAVPTITLSGSPNVCIGSGVLLTASGGGTPLWSNGSVASSIFVTTAGSYSLRIINGICTSVASTPVVVTVSTVPATPRITTTGSTFLCGSSATVMFSAPAGVTPLWSDGRTTPSITVNNSGLGSYTLRAINGACTSSASEPVFVTVGTGCTSWNGSSWSNGVPDATKDAIVYADLIVSTPMFAKSLNVGNGKITLNANLVVYGSVSTGRNVVSGSGSLIWQCGYSEEYISGTFSNLVVYGEGRIFASDTVNITSSLTLKRGQFVSNGKVVLRSGASIDDYSAGNTGYFPDNIVVEVRRNGGNIFEFDSPLSNINLNTVVNPYLTASQFVESSNAYLPIPSILANGIMQLTYGFRGNGTLRTQVYRGPLSYRSLYDRNGAINRPITRSAAVAGVDKGYNAMGNPFVSPISFPEFWRPNVNAGISSYAWVYNSATGQYGTILNSGQTTNGVSYKIAIGQGFLIRKLFTGNGNVVFTDAARTTGSAPFMRAPAETAANSIRLQLSSKDNTSLPSDEIIVHDVAGSSSAYDDNDAEKMHSPLEENISLYTIAGETELAVNAQEEGNTTNRTIPLGIKIPKAGKFEIAATELANFSNGNNSIILQDVKTGTSTLLHAGDSYSFTSEAIKEHRFNIIISGRNSYNNEIATVQSLDNLKAMVYFMNEDAMKDASIHVINTVGKVIQVVLGSEVSLQTEINLPLTGAYIIQVMSPSGKTSTKIISR